MGLGKNLLGWVIRRIFLEVKFLDNEVGLRIGVGSSVNLQQEINQLIHNPIGDETRYTQDLENFMNYLFYFTKHLVHPVNIMDLHM